MFDAIFNWLGNNYPWLIPAGLFGWAAWRLAPWVRQINDSMKVIKQLPCADNSHRLDTHDDIIRRLDETIAKMPCTDNSHRLDTHDDIIRRLDETIAKMPCADNSHRLDTHDASIENHTGLLRANHSMLSVIAKWVMKLDPDMIDPLSEAQSIYVMSVEKKSPRRLNDFGQKLFADLKGEEFLNAHKAELYRIIDSLTPKTAYDVELYALRSLQLSTDEDFFNDYKLYVYNLPMIDTTDKDGNPRKYELKLNDICVILSLPLRDMYLADKPDIPR